MVEDSPIEDVKRQYRQMQLINHSDKAGSLVLPANREKKEARYQRIQLAHDRLVKKMQEEAIARGADEDELSQYSVRFGTSNPFIV